VAVRVSGKLIHTPVIIEYRILDEENTVEILAFRYASRGR
jgi:hypothetical protein